MYLEHFGLSEPPFTITPVTEFFFSGANRGELLDALLYATTNSEGIVKVSGEVGSGKTMLCRMLLERLPANFKAIYLANPSLSRDELLHAIADGLGLNVEGQRLSLLLQNLNNHLVALYEQGIRCMVLVDEAHAMPLDTLEELRLLYNLQIGKHKLIQIVLFGQPELDEKLAQSNMRQLKDRILHNFNIRPLSRDTLESYLMFRMRAAGYHGPNIFTTQAINLLNRASQGLMRRVNILADKSLLAAFVENTHTIDTRHVQAAIRDTELTPPPAWPVQHRTALLVGGGLALALLAGWAIYLLLPNVPIPDQTMAAAPHPPLALSAPPAQAMAETSQAASTPGPSAATLPTASAVVAPPPEPAHEPALARLPANATLLQRRLAATEDMLAAAGGNSVSIQLYVTDNTDRWRMERFLGRAKNLGVLDQIFLLPTQLDGKNGYRVLYGHYADSNAGIAAMKTLPRRYQEAFAPALYPLKP